MKKIIAELEDSITQSFVNNSQLKNLVKLKELEKQDQLRGFAISIIEVLDSFENIENSLIEKGINQQEEVVKTMRRYESIKRKLTLILQKHGISKIEFTENRLILGFCEVLETKPDNSKNNDEIVSIIRNGYIRGKELIRSAQLIIVKN